MTGEVVREFTPGAHRVLPEWIGSLYHRGVAPWPLPSSDDGAIAHGEVNPAATSDGGWLPTVGPAWPTNVLSAVPQEDPAMHQLHAVFYLATDLMGDLDAQRGLHRTQMELVAFTDAAVARDRSSMALARDAFATVGGRDAVVRAAGCVGNFQMMNRLMDVLGVAEELGLGLPEHLRPDRGSPHGGVPPGAM